MDGFLVVDKPAGLTSHDVVAVARRALHERRIGHTGTLDPLATGVLPLACGRATRLVRFFVASDKDYTATVRFGLSTDTYDTTGVETARSDKLPTRDAIETALTSLRGEYMQMPPAFSAKKVGGDTRPEYGVGKLLTEIFEKTVEAKLVEPTFITEYPTEVSPLSRRNDANPDYADRFEFFVGGREIANGFSELNDPEDQAARFRAQAAAHERGDHEAMVYDADYIRALEYGLPPTAGAGIGIDRLAMFLTDSPSIRDVLLFPQMRPEA